MGYAGTLWGVKHTMMRLGGVEEKKEEKKVIAGLTTQNEISGTV